MSKTILLADDSITIQKVIELTFMDQDCEVVAVGTGDEAIEKLGEMKPDLVIADVHMPGADGYEVAGRSKERHPGVPVLLLVGTFEPFDESEMAASGADSHLKKPFDSQELLQLVERLMESAEEAAPAEEESAEAAPPEPPPGPRPVPEPVDAEPPEAEPSRPEPVEAAPAEAAPAPFPGGAETVRLDSLDLESGGPSVAEPAAGEAESPREISRETEVIAGEDVTWGNLDLEAVAEEEEEPPGSTEVEAPADATPLSEQDAKPAEPEDAGEPFRLSEPESEGFSLELEPEVESTPESAPEPAAPEAGAPEPEAPPAPEPKPPEPPRPEPVREPAAASSAAPPPSAPSSTAPSSAAAAAATGLSDADVERIARRVAELVGPEAIKDVAWEIVPDLAEVVIRDRIQQLESQVEGAESQS